MAIKNLTDIGISGSLADILLTDDSASKAKNSSEAENASEAEFSGSVFSKYRPKSEIGESILRDLYTTYGKGTGETKKGRGFFLVDGSKDVGVLSQCQSLQALLLLASEFGLKFDIDYTGKGADRTIRAVMDEVIEDLLTDKIKSVDAVDENGNPVLDENGNAKKQYVFDASPYETELFSVEYSNVDAIRWVIPTFLLVLKYHAEQGEICKWEDQLIDVISYGLDYINGAYIGTNLLGEELTSDKLEIGWNFTKDCEEPSLYYTFAVAECYISFYRTFEDHLKYQEAIRTEQETGGLIPIPDELKKYHAAIVDDYQKKMARPEPGYKDEANKLRKIARFDTPYELVRVYKRITGGHEEIDGTRYGDLEYRCSTVAEEIWRLVKNDFADNFFYNDLHAKISAEDIRMSTTSDALFNSVYIINTLIDAGVDEQLLLKYAVEKAKGNEEEAEKLLREYNDLLETCQLASQKALRTYEMLKKEGKEYIVDQFLIGFNENFETHKSLIKELRKRRMRVFSLLPMLIRSNNLISEYLVRYPQANMSKYLGYILENRRKDRNGKDTWLWEIDGFFSASNYYYVAALGQFYSYYETYEKNYIRISDENDEDTKRIREEYLTELTEKGQIAQLNDELRDKAAEMESLRLEKDTEIQRLETALANKRSPIEDAVKAILEETMREQLPTLFCAYMEKVAESYARLQLELKKNPRFKYQKAAERDDYQAALDFKAVIDKFIVSYVSKTLFGELDSLETGVEKAYDDASGKILIETGRALGEYTINVMQGKSISLNSLFKNDEAKENK